MLRIDVSTFYRHIYPYVLSGAIQSITIGCSRRVLVASLMEWIERQTARN